jgi:hypothetical protein
VVATRARQQGGDRKDSAALETMTYRLSGDTIVRMEEIAQVK